MDKYRIDSHKLIYHIPRVNSWLKGENIYPIYMEISPSGDCNHRCTFCALDFMGYQKRHLDVSMLKERLSEMAIHSCFVWRRGRTINSRMYCGTNQPYKKIWNRCSFDHKCSIIKRIFGGKNHG